ncbi:hypothetical protein [Micromonospora ureilytica]|uniref:hypothetical protein n=1 Tax=Micromonospora ureilytica TaxID=709868 RepID=UPI004039ACDC
MVSSFTGGAQGAADHSNVADTSGNQQGDLLDLFRDAAGITSGQDPAFSSTEKFERFHRDNPAVYRAMVMLCRQWINRNGHRNLGINSLAERVRWEITLATNDPDFKIDSNTAPWFSRLIMYREADMAALFKLRRAPEADAWIIELATREGRLDELPALMGWAADDVIGRAA